jgi:undecaprenyl-diphosphatase
MEWKMIDILKAVLFGIVQGITEWLPISSTGHMILVNEFVALNVTPEFWDAFLVVIQFGSILAVVVLFWNKIFPFDFKKKPVIKKDIFTLWFKIAVACIPAVVIGMPFDDIFSGLFYNYVCVAVALIVFGVLFLVVETRNKRVKPRVVELSDITYKMAFVIGIWQLIAAIFPGTSRSGATIIGALLLGISRTVAAEFTFFLAIPVMFGASLLKLLKAGLTFSAGEWSILLVGMAVAFIVSIVVIRFLMGYIKKHDFRIFGWYRIILGIVVLAYFILFR